MSEWLITWFLVFGAGIIFGIAIEGWARSLYQKEDEDG